MSLRSVWLFALILHIVGGVAWLWLMPGGFPLGHPHFLANRVIPMAMVVVGLVGVYAGHTGREAWFHAVFVALSAGWFSAALTGFALFPISARLLFPVALMVALGMAIPALRTAVRPHLRSRLTVILALLGVAVGMVIPWTQRAALPSTRPLNVVPTGLTTQPADTAAGFISLSSQLRFSPHGGAITFLRGRHVMIIEPMLNFISRSPDRCWTLFAPHALRNARERQLTHWGRDPSGARMHYTDLGASQLEVRSRAEAVAEIDAVSELGSAVYSHLNTYCEVSLTGFEGLALEFSPCAGTRVAVLPMDYPVGRPSRFAYLDAQGLFHVVEATSGEKGPFRKLASGKLERGAPLEITLHDAKRAIAVIVMEDWAAQVSTELSPTAGWGVPQNAIEFSLHGESTRSAASLFFTLASTSAGRGFDSVGHAAGIYRNRMTIRYLPP